MSSIESRRTALVCLLLAGATLAVYWQVSGFEFTNYDESVMILQNPHVLAGLTWKGFCWALTTFWFDYWHPLPWLSHMLDCQLFGLNAGGHHLVSVGFHVANALLLFVILRRMTGAFWRSAMVAGLFALHPLHVQSVAWVAERKDVLSALFFLLTLWAYARYVEGQRPKSNVQSHGAEVQSPTSNVQGLTSNVQGPDLTQRRREPQRVAEGSSALRSSAFLCVSALRMGPAGVWYWTAVAMFACGVMCKPMVVTLPFVLLLLDYWPLRRLKLPWFEVQSSTLSVQCSAPYQDQSLLMSAATQCSSGWRLIGEKLPFFALTLASCAITSVHVAGSGNSIAAEKVPWSLRLANVPVAYVRYLGKMLWPVDLAALYPMPSHWAWWQVGGALMVMGLCSGLAVVLIRRQPWLAVGWLWFVGMLVPVIALVPVWHIAMADRYTYLPLVGLFIAVVWGAAEFRVQSPKSKVQSQQGDVQGPKSKVQSREATASGSAFDVQRSALDVQSPVRTALLAVVAAVVLGVCGFLTWVQAGYWRNSLTLWTRALAVTTGNPTAQHNYGFALQQRGELPEAVVHYEEALRLEPNMYETQNNLGRALYQLGRLREATNHLMQAVRLGPGQTQAQANLGGALAALGDRRGAQEHYELAMAAAPGNATIPSDWGKALLAHGRAKEALERFEQALQLDPKFAEASVGCAFAHWQLGVALVAEGKLVEAAGQYREALRLEPDLPEVLNNLAWLLATAKDDRVRDGAEAVRSAQRACELTQNRQALFLGTLAAAYAEAGQFESARGAAQQAIALAETAGQAELAARNRELLKLYEAGRTCRQ